VIAPLFVSYLLFAAAYLDAWSRLRTPPTPPRPEGRDALPGPGG
jgi:hypothetical protein